MAKLFQYQALADPIVVTTVVPLPEFFETDAQIPERKKRSLPFIDYQVNRLHFYDYTQYFGVYYDPYAEYPRLHLNIEQPQYGDWNPEELCFVPDSHVYSRRKRRALQPDYSDRVWFDVAFTPDNYSYPRRKRRALQPQYGIPTPLTFDSVENSYVYSRRKKRALQPQYPGFIQLEFTDNSDISDFWQDDFYKPRKRKRLTQPQYGEPSHVTFDAVENLYSLPRRKRRVLRSGLFELIPLTSDLGFQVLDFPNPKRRVLQPRYGEEVPTELDQVQNYLGVPKRVRKFKVFNLEDWPRHDVVLVDSTLEYPRHKLKIIKDRYGEFAYTEFVPLHPEFYDTSEEQFRRRVRKIYPAYTEFISTTFDFVENSCGIPRRVKKVLQPRYGEQVHTELDLAYYIYEYQKRRRRVAQLRYGDAVHSDLEIVSFQLETPKRRRKPRQRQHDEYVEVPIPLPEFFEPDENYFYRRTRVIQPLYGDSILVPVIFYEVTTQTPTYKKRVVWVPYGERIHNDLEIVDPSLIYPRHKRRVIQPRYGEQVHTELDFVENSYYYRPRIIRVRYFDDQTDFLSIVVVGAMPDFFDPYTVDIASRTKPLDTCIPDDAGLWELLPAQITPFYNIHFNAGPAPFQGVLAYPGSYFGTYRQTTAAYACKSGLYYVPVRIPYDLRLTLFGVWIGTRDTASNAWLGLYSSRYGRPYELIYKNPIALNSTGYRPVPCSLFLTAGVYYFAFLTDSATALIRICTHDFTEILPVDHPDKGASAGIAYLETRTYSQGLPDDASSTLSVLTTADPVPRFIARAD